MVGLADVGAEPDGVVRVDGEAGAANDTLGGLLWQERKMSEKCEIGLGEAQEVTKGRREVSERCKIDGENAQE